ncbi:MAG: hypothetical protein M1816_003508 [Peltula sp. TS41687]|nr:MAG: hypothetical protein M1816_003508 [Peltula sp. TS41687]
MFDGKIDGQRNFASSQVTGLKSTHSESSRCRHQFVPSERQSSASMSLLRTSAAQRASMMLFQSRNWASPSQRRFQSTQPPLQAQPDEAPAPKDGESSMIREEGASGAMVRHDRQNYDPPIDHATSQFSPMPKRVLDGSEDSGVVPAAVLSGAPVELQARTVYIFRPSKTATQSGDWHGHVWRMDWEVLGKGHRWENDLMGWQSTGDFTHATHLDFKSKEDAIRFAEKQGYEYFVQEHQERKFVPKAYANNFVHSPRKLRVIRTK